MLYSLPGELMSKFTVSEKEPVMLVEVFWGHNIVLCKETRENTFLLIFLDNLPLS